MLLGTAAMNDQTDDLDQADEDILTYDVSDDALEAVAGWVKRSETMMLWTNTCTCCRE